MRSMKLKGNKNDGGLLGILSERVSLFSGKLNKI